MQPYLVYQNLIVNNALTGIEILTFDLSETDPKYGRYVNNTIVNNGAGGSSNVLMYNMAANSEFLFQNNIISGADYAFYYTGSNYSADRMAFVRNQGNGMADYGHLNVTDYDLAGWKTATGEDDDSIDTAPSFVNAAGGDYHLTQNGQPALTLGRVVHSIGGTNGDTIPAGCYITGSEEIGITA